MSRIPTPNSDGHSRIPKIEEKFEEGCVIFSFRLLEWTEYFGLNGTCNDWALDLFNMFKEVSKLKKSRLFSGEFSTYRVHNHANANPPNKLPDGVDLKNCYQIRIAKSKGGVHGIFVENVFYVIWLDPLHNMYPDDRFGGLRRVDPPKTCCSLNEDLVCRLNDRIEQLEGENRELMNLLDNYTTPENV